MPKNCIFHEQSSVLIVSDNSDSIVGSLNRDDQSTQFDIGTALIGQSNCSEAANSDINIVKHSSYVSPPQAVLFSLTKTPQKPNLHYSNESLISLGILPPNQPHDSPSELVSVIHQCQIPSLNEVGDDRGGSMTQPPTSYIQTGSRVEAKPVVSPDDYELESFSLSWEEQY